MRFSSEAINCDVVASVSAAAVAEPPPPACHFLQHPNGFPSSSSSSSCSFLRHVELITAADFEQHQPESSSLLLTPPNSLSPNIGYSYSRPNCRRTPTPLVQLPIPYSITSLHPPPAAAPEQQLPPRYHQGLSSSDADTTDLRLPPDSVPPVFPDPLPTSSSELQRGKAGKKLYKGQWATGKGTF